MDLISVIMPFYKKREYFLSSFKSVLSQSYTNIEIIIVYDDNNHDELNWVNSIVSNDKRTIIIDNKKILVFLVQEIWQYQNPTANIWHF